MTKKLILCVFTIVVLNARSQVVPDIDWITYYSSQDTIENVTSDMDANNTVYTTGYVYTSSTNIDLIVQARDSTGLLLWTTLYDNGGTDKGKAIKFLPGLGVFVTGVSVGSGKDYVTLKLNATTGATVWATRMNNFGNFDDEPNDIAVDASGNTFVTGFASASGGGNSDMVTVKYNSSGTQIWKNTYAGSAGGSNDVGNAIVLSSNGNTVYVTGNVNQTSSNCNIVTRAISTSAGTANWTSIFNGSANGNDKSYNIILAGANIVICGAAANNTTGLDHVTIKYNGSTGSAVWTNYYDYGNFTNIATDLVRDSTGNITITGYVYNNSTYSYHTIMYDSAGTSLFTNIENTGLSSITVFPHLACDSIAHHFYVSGEALRSTRDVFVYQISPTGNTKWKEYIDGQNYDLDAATSLVVNGIGVVYVSALSRNTFARYDITTIKISQTPVYFPVDYGTSELHDTNFVFQENKGQLLNTSLNPVSQADVAFFNRGVSPSLYFKNTRISHVFMDRDTIPDSLIRVDVDMVGANQLAQIYNYGKIDALKHYFTTSASGITDVGSYTRLFVPNVYSNVDLHYYSNTKGLKTYYVCKVLEGVNIPRFSISGATSTTVDAGGYLIANTGFGNVNLGKLTAYQVSYNISTLSFTLLPVTANWVSLGNDNYKFGVTGTTANLPIVVYISKPGATSAPSASPNGNIYWSTFIGEQGNEEMAKSTVDAKDNYYICGSTFSIFYPVTAGGFTTSPANSAGQQWGIFNKFRNDGKLTYGTYYGGTTSNCSPPQTKILDITLDSLYNVYIVGLTTTNNLTTKTISVTNALNYTANAGNNSTSCHDAFIAKINPSGNALRFASYWGGSQVESFTSVNYQNGKIYIGGGATSTNCPFITFPPGQYWQSTGEGVYLRLDTSGALISNTKVSNRVIAADIDKNGNYYQTANTVASGFGINLIQPASSFYQQTNQNQVDWTLQRFNTSNQLDWSTYIGGNQVDYPNDLSIRDSIMVIVGHGTSSNWPFIKNFTDSGEIAANHDFDVQIAKFDLTNGSLLWSVYHATYHNEKPSGVAIDKDYNVYVTGVVNCGTNTGTNTACTQSLFKPYATNGYYYQSGFVGVDAFLIGYNSLNQRKWTTFFGSLNNQNTAPYHDDLSNNIIINHSGKMFINGSLSTKNNSLPLVRWNNQCYYDSIISDPLPSSNRDGFISMFEISEFKIVGINEQNEIEVSNNVTLFPNPNNGIFTLRFKKLEYERLNINVINILGQRVYSKDAFKPDENEFSVNLGDISKGVYFINITENNKTSTIKFIIN